MDSRRFNVALSFPGEKRDFVSKVADSLANKFGKQKVLYDKYHEAEFARPNLDVHLPNLYSSESELIAIFLCAEYKQKRWCNLEWRSIRQLIATADEERIMFLSFDNVGAIPEIGILSGDGYVSIGDRSPEQIAELILSRCQSPQIDPIVSSTDRFDISRIIKYAPAELVGREIELKTLSDAWEQAVNQETKRAHILTFVALGGEGKTSLVAKWAAELAHQGWSGCDAAFAWSFYSQGTSEKTQASSDSFLKEALVFFGDVDMANSASSSFDKGRRLAQLVGERRALLILDGVEPLQYAPTSPTGSELKDQGVAALLKALASNNEGLCVVTTRYSIPDLRNFWQTTAPEIRLKSLSSEAGVSLLRRLGMKGRQAEFEQLVRDVKGHALTLNLLGSFLRDAHAGDIRKRDLVKLEEADAEEQSGHAFHVMDAYVESFKREGEKGMRALSVLRLLGLFDRPATADCLNALWTGEEIGGLTGPLLAVSEAQRNVTLKRLEDANLITVNREKGSETLISLDAHPLLREYFATRVRKELPGAWRAAHQRLFEYLRDATKEGDGPRLEDLQPLYQAVAHGCQAGLQQEACDEVYFARIKRREENYSSRKLAAFGSDLAAIAFFFEEPWSRISMALTESDQAWILGEAAFRLRALGRLREAIEPLQAALEMAKRFAEMATEEMMRTHQLKQVATQANNLTELELSLGEVSRALAHAEESVTYADLSRDHFERESERGGLADVLNQAGRPDQALAIFAQIEEMQVIRVSQYPLCFSVRGFRYCDLLLATPERAAWRVMLQLGAGSRESESLDKCLAVSERAAQTLTWVVSWQIDILSAALDRLTLGRAALYEAVLSAPVLPLRTESLKPKTFVNSALSGLRDANQQIMLPNGLLTSAWLLYVTGACTGPESAQSDLDEAWEIAERGPMRLHMADIHLYRARLFHGVKPYPWNKFPDGSEGRGPKDDLKDARDLIERCGYGRRKEELEDAEEAAKNWT